MAGSVALLDPMSIGLRRPDMGRLVHVPHGFASRQEGASGPFTFAAMHPRSIGNALVQSIPAPFVMSIENGVSATISTRYENFLIFLAPLINSVGGIAIDLYAPSIPSIGKEFGVNAALMQNTITITLVFYAIGQLAFGVLADWRGRRWSVLLGLLLFLIGSAIAGFSQSYAILMLGRAMQGFAVGSCQVVARAVLIDRIKGERFRVAIVYLSLAFALAPVLAPYVGGVIEVFAGWRWNFVAYFTYGSIVFAFALFGLEESLPPEARRKPMKLGYEEVLRNPQFISATVMLGAGFGAFLMWSVIGPYIVQIRFGYSASFFGSTALGVGLSYLLGTVLNRSLIKRRSAIQLMSLGMKIFACGILFVISSGLSLHLITVVGGIMLISFAQGFIFSNAMACSMRMFPSRAGAAASLQGCLMIAIGSMSSAVISAINIESNLAVAIAFLCLLIIAFIAFHRFVQGEEKLSYS